MADLTLQAFAYLRLPLAVAGAAFVVGAVGAVMGRTQTTKGDRQCHVPIAALTVMMVLFFHAARLALVVFDPYMSSRPLAEALNQAPPGELIVDDQYYTFSSVFFYSNRTALLLNGRVNNLEYGSYRPGAPRMFLKDADLPGLWSSRQRYYLVAENPQIPRLDKLVGADRLHQVASAGGKTLFVNQ